MCKGNSKITLFDKRCYELLKQVPAGKITTYKALAMALGSKAYRAVGSAMSKNPYLPKVPCHRVVKSDGKIGEYQLGFQKKIEMLKNEGIEINGNYIADLEKYLYKF